MRTRYEPMWSVQTRADRGFSLVELMVALVLAGLVAGMTHRVLLVNRRLAEGQIRWAEDEATLREASVILRSELQPLTTADSVHTDLRTMSASAIAYAATRTLRFLCAQPDTIHHVVIARNPYYGLRDLDPGIDSVLLLVPGHRSERWVRAAISGLDHSPCADGATGVGVHLSGVSGAVLATVSPSSPLLGFEISELRSYRDAQGEWWIGMRRYQQDRGAWPPIQPAVGPLAPGGLKIEYLTSTGGPAGAATEVRFIRAEVTVAHRSFSRRGRITSPRSALVQIFPRGGVR